MFLRVEALVPHKQGGGNMRLPFLRQCCCVCLHPPVCREVVVAVAFTSSSNGGLTGTSSPPGSVPCYSVNHSRLVPSEQAPALTDAGGFLMRPLPSSPDDLQHDHF